MDRRVVAEQHDFHPLQPHHPVGLRPPPVVADAHAHPAVEGIEDRKAEIAGLEVRFLEVLEGPVRLVVRVPGQVHLAVLPGDAAGGVDENRCIEAPFPVSFPGELGVPEVEPDFELPAQLEERHGRPARHFRFVEGVELRLVLHPPSGKEGGERELREDHESGAASVGLAHHVHHSGDRGFARLAAGDRTHLGGSDADRSAHGPGSSLLSPPTPCILPRNRWGPRRPAAVSHRFSEASGARVAVGSGSHGPLTRARWRPLARNR